MSIERLNVTDNDMRRFCTFTLAGRLCGVDILDVKEVNPENRITRVFHAPPEVEGFVNIRGNINLVLNLRRILGFEDEPPGDGSRLVLFKPRVGESFGVFVDSIEEVRMVQDDAIETGSFLDKEPAAGEERMDTGEVLSGVCRLNGALLLIINAHNLLKVVEQKLLEQNRGGA
jgi:chemotaxis signal transduction protein